MFHRLRLQSFLPSSVTLKGFILPLMFLQHRLLFYDQPSPQTSLTDGDGRRGNVCLHQRQLTSFLSGLKQFEDRNDQ